MVLKLKFKQPDKDNLWNLDSNKDQAGKKTRMS